MSEIWLATSGSIADVCGWCGFTPLGTPREHDGIAFCDGPGVPEPSCWQQYASEGRVVAVDFDRPRYRGDSGVD